MIVFAHLLNDSSGSPRVLSSAIHALSDGRREMFLCVGSEGCGCLESAGIPVRKYWYRRSRYRVLTLFTYVVSQVCLFFQLLRMGGVPDHAAIYVNTLLPFGAALFGRATGRRVIYHLHEVSISPAPLRWLLTWVARRTADQLIYVSEFHRQCLPIAGLPGLVIYNSVSPEFAASAARFEYRHRHEDTFRVLMLASLRDYKGVPEFVQLAQRFSTRDDVKFDLVINDDQQAIDRYFGQQIVPSCLTLHGRTARPEQHYQRATLVVNLSRPDECVETFGLTILEAMAFGIPVIAPPVGGPAELVEDGKQGFLVDSRNSQELARKVRALADNEDLCMRMSSAARDRAKLFSQQEFARRILATVDRTFEVSRT